MSSARLWKMPLALTAAIVVLVGTSAAMAGLSLVAIPKVTNGGDGLVQVGTFPTCITPDGLYVGGIAGLAFESSGSDTGFVWDANLGSRNFAAGSWQSSVNGIGYRQPTDGGPTELVVGGDNAGWQSMNASTDFGTVGETWAKRRRSNTHAYDGGYNTVSGGSTGGVIYSTFQTPKSDTPQLYVDAWGDLGWASAPDTKGTSSKSNIYGVSNTGVAVGRRKADSDGDGVENYQNYILTFNGSGGLAATWSEGLDPAHYRDGELWDIADDGSWAGGISPVAGKTGMWAYVRKMSDGSVYELPTADPTATYDVNSRVYGMGPNGDYAVGMDFTAGGIEKAVLWDIGDPDPNNWMVLDLTQWASDNDILGPFTGNLRRAIAMGVNGQGQPVITGVGYASSLEADGWTGFVLTVPEPGTVTLLAIAGLLLLLFRPRR